MEAQTLHLPPLQEVVNRIFASRRITRMDQRLLLTLGSSNQEAQALINQVFDRLHRGLLRVVD